MEELRADLKQKYERSKAEALNNNSRTLITNEKSPTRLEDLKNFYTMSDIFYQSIKNVNIANLPESQCEALQVDLTELVTILKDLSFPFKENRSRELQRCKVILDFLITPAIKNVGYTLDNLKTKFWSFKESIYNEIKIFERKRPRFEEPFDTSYQDLPDDMLKLIYVHGLHGYKTFSDILTFINTYARLNKCHYELIKDANILKITTEILHQINIPTAECKKLVEYFCDKRVGHLLQVIMEHPGSPLYVMATFKEPMNVRKRALDLDHSLLFRVIRQGWYDGLEILLKHNLTVHYVYAAKFSSKQNDQLVRKPKHASKKKKNAPIDHESILHFAAMKSDINMVKLILRCFPSLKNTLDHKSRLPLHRAIRHKRFDVCGNELIDCRTINQKNCYGESPLFYAIRTNDIKAVQLLLEQGADIHLIDNAGNAVLHVAALYASTEVAKFLMRKRALLDPKNKSNELPIHYAVQNKNFSGEMTQLFLDVDPSSINHADSMNRTPIFRAVEHADFGTVELLLQHNPNLEHRDSRGLTACHVAAELKKYQIIKMLVRYRPEVLHSPDNLKQETPLQFCWNRTIYEKESYTTVKTLVELGSRVDDGFVTNRHFWAGSLLYSATETFMDGYAGEENHNLIQWLANRGAILSGPGVSETSENGKFTFFHSSSRGGQLWPVLENEIESALRNKARNESFLKRFDLLYKNIDTKWQDNPLTHRKKHIIADFMSFASTRLAESSEKILTQWSADYRAKYNINPFAVLNEQRRQTTFIRFFNPRHTKSLGSFIDYLGNEPRPDLLESTLETARNNSRFFCCR